GHSLGGHNGVFTAAFDPRIRIVITSCGLDSFRDYYDGNPAVWQAGKGWCQDRYMPRLAAYQGRLQDLPFDFPQVLAAIAPRRVVIFAPEGDTNFRWRSVDRVAAEARALATSAGVTADIRVEHPAGPHRFPPESREEAYRQLDAVLKFP
ncbi:MAG: alpha/beta hydrolase, partial [Verrucomicrobiales bacterium]|nr:alpha/beta hydrolase [Verrucomicrobiales bacterium]